MEAANLSTLMKFGNATGNYRASPGNYLAPHEKGCTPHFNVDTPNEKKNVQGGLLGVLESGLKCQARHRQICSRLKLSLCVNVRPYRVSLGYIWEILNLQFAWLVRGGEGGEGRGRCLSVLSVSVTAT